MFVVSTGLSSLHNSFYFYLMFGDVVKSDSCFEMCPL